MTKHIAIIKARYLGIIAMFAVMLFTGVSLGTARADIIDPETKNRFEAAAAYSAQRGGISFLILKDGELVFEQYDGDGAITKPNRIFSGTKSFWGVLAICMVQDGLVKLNEPVWETIIEWHSDPRKKRIRLRHLLDQSSGLDTAFYALNGNRVEHKYRYAIGLTGETEPGEVFHYGPGHYYLLGEFIQRKLEKTTGESPLAYLKRRLLDPIGIEIADWAMDDAGNPYMPSGAVLTARQWAKFGQFILDQGKVGEKSLVDSLLLRETFRASPANPQYGLSWWLNHPIPADDDWRSRKLTEVPKSQGFEKDEDNRYWLAPRAPRDMITAIGAEGQRMYIIPSMNMVIVRQAQGRMLFRDSEMLDLLLGTERSNDAQRTGLRSR